MISVITRPFYFIRHGETEWNEKGIIQGHTDIPLNALGLEQAQQACHILKEKEIGRIYTSTLTRASQTAQIIAQDLNLEVMEIPHLQERNWGEIEGQGCDKLRDVLQGYPSLLDVPNQQLPKGAETSETFMSRVRGGIVQVLAEEKSLPLIVSHGGVFQVLVRLMALEPISIENCQLFYFRGSCAEFQLCNTAKRRRWVLMQLISYPSLKLKVLQFLVLPIKIETNLSQPSMCT